MKNKKCVFCEKIVSGYGNNPEPLEKVGVACDSCNIKWVIPARIYTRNQLKKIKGQ